MFARRVTDGLIAGGLHLAISVLIAVFVYLLVRHTWFALPWDQLMDGDGLLIMLISIDVICGPLLTALVVHSAKDRWKNVLDIVVIACIQLSALVFGLWTAWQAKPSWLVFEGDRFVAVRYADLLIPDENDRRTIALPRLVGIELKAVSALAGSDPRFLSSLSLSLQGIPPSYRPERWIDFGEVTYLVSAVAQDRPEWSKQILLGQVQVYPLYLGVEIKEMMPARFVPLQVGLHTNWVVLVDAESFKPFALMQADAWAEKTAN